LGTTPGRSDDADERNDDHEGDDVVLALARTRARATTAVATAMLAFSTRAVNAGTTLNNNNNDRSSNNMSIRQVPAYIEFRKVQISYDIFMF